LHGVRAALIGLALVLASVVSAAADRVALVIGEGSYQTLPVLKTPALNASLMDEALQSLNFRVTTLVDANRADLAAALDRFAGEAAAADTVVVYFSGATFQYQGANHLVPVDATLASAGAVETETLRLDAVISRLTSPNRPLLVFIDSGPGTPLPPALQGGAGPGLAQPALAGRDPVMVALSAEPGHVPMTETGAFSTFTLGLQSYLPSADKPLADVMRWVQRDLEAATGKAQSPWVYSTLDAAYSLSAIAAAKPATPQPPAPQPPAPQPQPQPPAPQLPVLQPPAAPQPAPAEPAAPALSALGATPPASPARTPEADPPKRMALRAFLLPRGYDSAPSSGQTAAPSIALLPTLRQIVPDRHVTPLSATADGVQLAAVPPTTRLGPAAPVFTTLPGTVVLDNGTRMPMLSGADLAKAIQKELTRVGCYQGGADGNFGPGSQNALATYFQAKNLPTDQTAPTDTAYAQLLAETDTVCKAPPKPAVTVQPPKPQVYTPPKPQVAPAPAKPVPPVAAVPDTGGGKIKKLILIPNF
jgi:peptidoglycan hydrolase-like protein with peptidoglycan-binding domain